MKKRPARPSVARPRRTARDADFRALDGDLRRLLDRHEPVIDLEETRELDETRIVIQKRRTEPAGPFVRRVREEAGRHAVVEPLFPSYRPRRDLATLQDFFLVRWPHLDPRTLTVSLWDLAYKLQDATRSVNATPDPFVRLGPCSAAVREPDSVPDPAVVSPMASVLTPDNAGWHLFAANVPAAWAVPSTFQGAGIVIGHIDTGVAPHILLGGRLDLAGGFNFLRPGSPPVPPASVSQPGSILGHGTFSSTTIAGAPDPGTLTRPPTGFTGVAPGATIRPTRVTNAVVLGPLSYVSRAIKFLTDSGAAVISISLGGPNFSPCLHWALNNAVANNIIVVAAAGQGFKSVVLPAALRNCVAVAGTKLNDTTGLSNDFAVMRDRLTLWGPSATGPKVAIAAPAKDIRHGAPGAVDGTGASTTMGGPSQGTTFATAMVAGVAALWLERRGRGTLRRRYRNRRSLASVFKEVLADSAYLPPNWHGSRWGPGALDARGVLDAALPPQIPPDPPTLGAFMAQFDSFDILETFEDLFPDLDPDALRAGLRRLLRVATETEWRAALERFGVELVNHLAADSDAAARFAETAAAEAANDAAAAIEGARQTARAVADEASQRLRDRFGG